LINNKKPQAIYYAEWVLWVWTGWECLFGTYQSWVGIPELEKLITDQIQVGIPISPQTFMELIIVAYGMLAALSGWIILQISAGRKWARSSLLWGFVLQVIWWMVSPCHNIIDCLADVPDFGLQGYALYMLYTESGRRWFSQK
jgi:hypothetical protein